MPELDRAQRGTDFNLPVRSCEYLVNLLTERERILQEELSILNEASRFA